MTPRKPKNPALTKDGILSEAEKERAAKLAAIARVPRRYTGPVAKPLPGLLEDIQAHEAADWDAIDRESHT